MRLFLFFSLVASSLCACAPPNSARCTDTAGGLDCEAVLAQATCAPPLPDGSSCALPPPDVAENERNAEAAIRSDLGVAATVRSFETKRGIHTRRVVTVWLKQMPPFGDTQRVRLRVWKKVRDTFGPHVGLEVVLADSRERVW
jgi:hypothetical protein